MLSARPDERIFALVDVNNFYASCERVFQPKYSRLPVVVLSNNDGCIISRSNEAKQIGIKMGAPLHLIEPNLKKQLIIFSSNYALYADLSRRFFENLKSFSNSVEQYSIDEVFLDIGFVKKENLVELGHEIKKRIWQNVKLPVSVGIGTTKTLSKLANKYAKDIKKLNGVCNLVNHPNIGKILQISEVEKVWGIGFASTTALRKENILNALDFRNAKESWIKKRFTVVGFKIQQELKGIPCIEMETIRPPKKNIMMSRSFGRRVRDYDEMVQAVSTYASIATDKLIKENEYTKSITIYLRAEKSSTQKKRNIYETVLLKNPTRSIQKIVKASLYVLKKCFVENIEYKKAGVILGKLDLKEFLQMDLFLLDETDKEEKFMDFYSNLRENFGRRKMFIASCGTGDKKWQMRGELVSPRYSTRDTDIRIIKI